MERTYKGKKEEVVNGGTIVGLIEMEVEERNLS